MMEYNNSDASRSTLTFNIGSVQDGKIRINRGYFEKGIIIKQGDYLGLVRVRGNRADILTVRLISVESSASLSGIRRYSPNIIRQFNAAGCNASRPTRR